MIISYHQLNTYGKLLLVHFSNPHHNPAKDIRTFVLQLRKANTQNAQMQSLVQNHIIIAIELGFLENSTEELVVVRGFTSALYT